MRRYEVLHVAGGQQQMRTGTHRGPAFGRVWDVSSRRTRRAVVGLGAWTRTRLLRTHGSVGSTQAQAQPTLSGELFQPGSGYGDPGALLQDQHRLESARREAERLFREYHELDRRLIDDQMLRLQRSQRTAAWCSVAVAVVVDAATVISIVVALFT